MKDLEDTCKLAIIQASPVIFDKAACLQKALALTAEAGRNGAQLIVFPELFIPGYPYGMNYGFSVGRREESGREIWKRYYDNSLLVPGPDCEALAMAAREAGAYLSIGVSEREARTATLYNSNLIFDPNGNLVSLHRKLKPTGSERLVWGDANSHYFPVVDSPWGMMGALICWESYMPLARVALYEKGLSLYLAPNTNDNEEWQATIRHIAIEGHCYFINANMVFNKSDFPEELRQIDDLSRLTDPLCRGGSCVVDPYGHYLTEPLWDAEGIIYADLDMQKVPASRMEFDVCGHYSRPELFNFKAPEG